MSIEVREAAGAEDVRAALALRHEVFCVEQGVPLEEELDGRDEEAVHLLAVDDDGTLAGTCRLLLDALPKVKLGRMVVERRRRGRGIAGALLVAAERRARAAGADRIVLAAQLTAVPVYERAGYVAYGEVFDDAGIDHTWMELRLA